MIRACCLIIILSLSFSISSWAGSSGAASREVEEYSGVLGEIKALMAAGKLMAAYRIALPYRDSSIAVDLKLAQISMLMGKEQQAADIFEGLRVHPDTSDLQKRNMKRFIAKFDKSQKKKVRQVKQMAKAGDCDQAKVIYQRLFNSPSQQRVLKKAIAPCMGIADTFEWLARVSVATGYDDNVALSNEDLIGPPQAVIEGHYQDVALRTSAKLDLSSTLRITPEYSYFQRQYDTSIASKYDQSSHRLQLQLAGIIQSGLSWKLPIFYRYSQFAQKHYADYTGFKFRLNNRREFGSHRYSIAWQQKKYVESSDQYRNADIVEVGYRYSLNWQLYRITSAVFLRDLSRPEDESDSYRRGGMDVDLSKSFLAILGSRINSSIYAAYNQSYSQYRTADPSLGQRYGADYNKARQDNRSEWRIGARLNMDQWQLRTHYSQQTRNSNLDLYDFQRTKVEMGLSYQF